MDLKLSKSWYEAQSKREEKFLDVAAGMTKGITSIVKVGRKHASNTKVSKNSDRSHGKISAQKIK